jgi:hypothetical protein
MAGMIRGAIEMNDWLTPEYTVAYNPKTGGMMVVDASGTVTPQGNISISLAVDSGEQAWSRPYDPYAWDDNFL